MKLEKFKQRDPKKIGITIFTVVCILLVAGVFFYTSFASFESKETYNIMEGTVTNPGDIYFAFYIDDKITKTMPQKGEGYVLDKEKTTCTNGASIDFNETDWSVKVLNMTKAYTKCTLYFKKYVPTAVETILAKGETEELAYDNTTDNNLRYIGANPNNYVQFNNELWRIIGVFNNIDDGTGAKETRLKIIRYESYNTGIAWNTDNVNDWTTGSLQQELNGTYLESITSPSKEMIGNTKWNLGGADSYTSSSNGLASHWYIYERGTKVYSGRPTEWTGKVGLMYPSDYGYATSGGSGVDREMCLNTALSHWYDYADCKNNDWLSDRANSQWTLTPHSSDWGGAIYMDTSGHISYYSVNIAGYAALPTLYLNSNVKISGGDGTKESPFTLSL